MSLDLARLRDHAFVQLRAHGASEDVAHLTAYHRVNGNPYEGPARDLPLRSRLPDLREPPRPGGAARPSRREDPVIIWTTVMFPRVRESVTRQGWLVLHRSNDAILGKTHLIVSTDPVYASAGGKA